MRWKAVNNYEGLYEVSDCGMVRSIDRCVNHYSGGKSRKKGKMLRPGRSLDHYYTVSLCRKTQKVHRLVAQAFVDNPFNKKVVNHKDGDKTNNHYTNLEWVTHKENIRHALRNGFIQKKSTLNPQEVKAVYNSALECNRLAKIFGVSIRTIYRIKNKSLKCYQEIP